VTTDFRQSPGHLIRRCLQLHNTLFAEGTAGLGITAPQWAALRALHEYPGIEQIKLSELIAYDPSTIGGLVDRLESKGLVGRSSDATDRRLKRLNLTPAGRRFFETHRDDVRAVTNRFVAHLSHDEVEQLTKLLGRLLDDDAEEQRQPVRREVAS
jgi:MarR family transcriptional regulator, lower aerobic nicotinate degradation pathway regulator